MLVYMKDESQYLVSLNKEIPTKYVLEFNVIFLLSTQTGNSRHFHHFPANSYTVQLHHHI